MPRKAKDPVPQPDGLAEAIAKFDHNPLGFVLFAYPWGQPGTPLEDEAPDIWQVNFLIALQEELEKRRGPEAAVQRAIRMATASGHGIGKTTLVAWIIDWFMSTRVCPHIVVTANTATQLETKTWRELSKWHRLSINESWFTWTATKFYNKEKPELWSAICQPWSKDRSEAFAGTHEKHVLVIYDEASAIDDVIWEVTEGAMTTPGAIWLVFGNPTRNVGRFRECFRKFRKVWRVFQVDSRDARKSNKAEIEEWIESYGEDSDFVRVRVAGKFPRSSTSQFIPTDIVEAAQARWKARRRGKSGDDFEGWDDGVPDTVPLILACDPARFGHNDSVIGLRRGSVFRVIARYNGLDTVELAHRIAVFIQLHQPDAVFVDEPGIGSGVVDTLRHLGYDVIGVNTGLPAFRSDQFFNRRAEMWWLLRDWLKAGAILDDNKDLLTDLIGPEYGFAGRDLVQLETKEDMRLRNLPSPDLADCLALTFAAPVAPRSGSGSRSKALYGIEVEDGSTFMSVRGPSGGTDNEWNCSRGLSRGHRYFCGFRMEEVCGHRFQGGPAISFRIRAAIEPASRHGFFACLQDTAGWRRPVGFLDATHLLQCRADAQYLALARPQEARHGQSHPVQPDGPVW